jgi:hypothetical protein
MYHVLSLANSTLLTADMILLCTEKNLYLVHDSHSPFHRRMCILPQVRCHCPPIWPLPLNLTYLASSLETVFSEPSLYKLLTFHVPKLISIFHSLGHLSKESIQVRGSVIIFVTSLFLRLRVVIPTPKLENYPLSFARSCLFSVFSSNHHSFRPFLHPQPKDVPCFGDGPLLTWAVPQHMFLAGSCQFHFQLLLT